MAPNTANMVSNAAKALGVDADLLAALAMAEHSWFKDGQIQVGIDDGTVAETEGKYDEGLGPANGVGFMQVVPYDPGEGEGRLREGYDVYTTQGNFMAAASLVKSLVDTYGGDVYKVASAYNGAGGGEGTNNYASRVVALKGGRATVSNTDGTGDSPSTTPTNNAMGDLPQDSEMVRYCKIVSEKTGVRADFILAQLISESGWDMLNQHKPGYNYGNAGGGGYATFNSLEEAANFMADHPIAYAKDRQALAAAANRGDAAAFVHILAQNGYFTTLESKYLATFESVLAQLKNRGVNLGAFGSGDLSGLLKNFKPKTLSEQAEDNAKRFANALQSIGVSSGKTGQGRIVDGMYVDIGSKFESIDEIRKRYEAMDAQKPKNETYISKYHESAQKATDDAAKRSLKQVS